MPSLRRRFSLKFIVMPAFSIGTKFFPNIILLRIRVMEHQIIWKLSADMGLLFFIVSASDLIAQPVPKYTGLAT